MTQGRGPMRAEFAFHLRRLGSFADETTFVGDIIRFSRGGWVGTKDSFIVCNRKIDHLACAVDAPSSSKSEPTAGSSVRKM
jgi:hypothetical protein